MKVKTINYQKVFPLAQYVNERIGVEIELSIHDSEDEAFAKAKELVHSWADEKSQLHDSSEPYPYSGIAMPYTPIQNPTTIPKLKYSPQIPSIDGMLNCQTVEELEQKFFQSIDAIRDDAEKKKYFDTYDEVYAKLSNQNTTTK
jgi:hypothetical protein